MASLNIPDKHKIVAIIPYYNTEAHISEVVSCYYQTGR